MNVKINNRGEKDMANDTNGRELIDYYISKDGETIVAVFSNTTLYLPAKNIVQIAPLLGVDADSIKQKGAANNEEKTEVKTEPEKQEEPKVEVQPVVQTAKDIKKKFENKIKYYTTPIRRRIGAWGLVLTIWFSGPTLANFIVNKTENLVERVTKEFNLNKAAESKTTAIPGVDYAVSSPVPSAVAISNINYGEEFAEDSFNECVEYYKGQFNSAELPISDSDLKTIIALANGYNPGEIEVKENVVGPVDKISEYNIKNPDKAIDLSGLFIGSDKEAIRAGIKESLNVCENLAIANTNKDGNAIKDATDNLFKYATTNLIDKEQEGPSNMVAAIIEASSVTSAVSLQMTGDPAENRFKSTKVLNAEFDARNNLSIELYGGKLKPLPNGISIEDNTKTR